MFADAAHRLLEAGGDVYNREELLKNIRSTRFTYAATSDFCFNYDFYVVILREKEIGDGRKYDYMLSEK